MQQFTKRSCRNERLALGPLSRFTRIIYLLRSTISWTEDWATSKNIEQRSNLDLSSLCLNIVLPCFKLCNHCCATVTKWLVPWPVGFLTVTGAIRCTSTSTTVLCFTAFNHSAWKLTLRVVANAHLRNMLHICVFLVQARAGNAMPKEFHQRMLIGQERNFFYFDPMDSSLGLFKPNCDVLLHIPGISSNLTSTILVTVPNKLRSPT